MKKTLQLQIGLAWRKLSRSYKRQRLSDLWREENFPNVKPVVLNPTRPPIIVLQPGKVGSSTICNTLAATIGAPNIIHSHGLTQTLWDGLHEYGKGNFQGDTYLSGCIAMEREAQELRHEIARWHATEHTCSDPPLRIITIVRDPIAAQLSAIFHLAESAIPEINGTEPLRREASRQIGIQLKNAITDWISGRPHRSNNFIYKAAYQNFTFIPAWYKREIPIAFGQEKSTQPFDFDRGFTIEENGSAKLLTLRFENLKETLVDALSTFMDNQTFTIVNANETNLKAYASEYAEFKRTFKFPQKFIDAQYQTDHMKRYYKQQEIDALRSKWVEQH